MNDTNSRGKKSSKTGVRAVIADLPFGVNVYRENGGYRVRLGSKFTGLKEPKKLRFDTLAGAREFIFGGEAEKLRSTQPGAIDLKRDLGRNAFVAPRHLFAEATHAAKLLEESSASVGLIDAVRFYIKHAGARVGDWTVEEASLACQNHLRAKGRSKRYIEGLGWSFGRFQQDFAKARIHEISNTEIEDWLDEEDFEPVTRNNYVRDLKVLFNFTLKRKRLSINPMQEIEREQIDATDVQILPIAGVARVLLAAQAVEGMLVPTAIKFFAGLRTSEVCQLTWAEIQETSIVVSSGKAKTRQRRPVTISANLKQWLNMVKPTDRIGFVAPQGAAWRRRFEIVKTLSGIDPWPRNVQRHCYGSYFYAKVRNENLTAAEMGNTPAVVHKHYRAVVENRKLVENYWKIAPPNVRKFTEWNAAKLREFSSEGQQS